MNNCLKTDKRNVLLHFRGENQYTAALRTRRFAIGTHMCLEIATLHRNSTIWTRNGKRVELVQHGLQDNIFNLKRASTTNWARVHSVHTRCAKQLATSVVLHWTEHGSGAHTTLKIFINNFTNVVKLDTSGACSANRRKKNKRWISCCSGSRSR
jgi:hypothetical protein